VRNPPTLKASVGRRDELLSEIGVKFSKEYFMKRYNLGKGDFELN